MSSFHAQLLFHVTSILIPVCSLLVAVEAKTFSDVVTSVRAQREWGQYLTSFCFHGNAIVNYTLNVTSNPRAQLYLYLIEDWRDSLQDEDCNEKLKKASFVVDLASIHGNFSVSYSEYPKLWNLLFVDDYTCDSDRPLMPGEQMNFISLELKLLNPDSLGNPTEHFGDDETGLLRFYQLLTLAYFVLGCIFFPRLHETLHKGGPMQLVIQLLTTATILQAVGAFTLMVHLQWYSNDGMGSSFLEILAEFFDIVSQFAMLYMLLSLSLGWTLGTSYRFSHIKLISRKPAARVIAVFGVLQAILFLWEQFEDIDHRMYHAHKSYSGLALVFVRILLAAMFAWNLNVTVSSERSSLRREFYKSFTKCCMLWFLCYPFVVVFSWILSEYLRYKFITMSVVIFQCSAVIMLYKLFLSRSLYWEISALSSALPLRIDKNFSMKAFS